MSYGRDCVEAPSSDCVVRRGPPGAEKTPGIVHGVSGRSYAGGRLDDAGLRWGYGILREFERSSPVPVGVVWFVS